MKKVYSSWAFTNDQELKYLANREFYKENSGCDRFSNH